MKSKLHRLSRSLYVALALALSSITAVPALAGMAAADQISTRSIKMSSAAVSASNASYLVTFTTGSAGTGLSLIIDFCQNDPIIGDSCTTTNGVTFTSAGISGGNLPAGWAFDTTSGSTFKIKGTTTPLSATTSYNFTMTGVNNPTGTSATSGAAGSFYARLYTFSNNTYGTYTNAGSPGNYVDYGGFALSTAASINITAKVMETLAFCVYPDGNSCGTSPDFTIGHSVGGTTVIDSSAVDTSLTDFSLSTNASGGATVRLKGDTLKFGTNSIPAAGSSAITFAAGTANFGMRISTAGSCTATSPYDGGSGTQYAFNTTNTTSTYGDGICSTSGAVNASVTKLTWAATASNTTPAGVYTSTEQLIATGTF